MAGTLDGKRAIVTGGGQGIGRGIALALAAEGAAVALVGRTEAKLLAVAAEIEKPGGTALPVVADVTRPADIQRCVDGHGQRTGRHRHPGEQRADHPRSARSSRSPTRPSAPAGNPGRWPRSG